MPEFLNAIQGLLGGGSAVGAAPLRVVADTRGVVSNIRTTVTGANAELGRLGEGASRGVREFGHAADETAHKVNHLARVAKIGFYTLATAIPIIGIASIKAAVDYETAFAGVRKTVDATEKQFEMLSRQFREMAKVTPGTAAEFAKLGEAAGQLGIAADNIAEFVDVASTIGDTTNVSADQAAMSLGQLSNVLKLTREDYKRFGSTLVDLGNKGASTEAQILEIAARSGAAGALIGMSAKDVLAFASSVASLGIEVEAGGTALQTFYLQINKLVGSGAVLDDLSRKTGLSKDRLVELAQATKGKAKDSFEDLAKSVGKTGKELRALILGAKGLEVVAKTAGMTASAYKRFYEDDPTAALQRFIVGLGRQDQYERQRTLNDIGMTDSRRIKMLLALSDNTKLLSNNLQWANDAWRDNTALMAEAEKRYKTTASQLQIMKNNFTDIAIELGTSFLPTIVSAAKWLGKVVPEAARTLGDIFNRVLLEPAQRLVAALGNLGDAVAGVFSFAESGPGSGDGMVRVFEALAGSAASLADHLSGVINLLADLGRSPVGQMLGRLAVTLGAAALALKFARGAANLGVKAVGGAVGSLTGLNPFEASAAAKQHAEDLSTAKVIGSAIEAAGVRAGTAISDALLRLSGLFATNLIEAGRTVGVDMRSTATATAKTIQSGFVGIRTTLNVPVAGLKSAAKQLSGAATLLTRAAVAWKTDVLAAIRQAGGVFFMRDAKGRFLPEATSWARLQALGLTGAATAGAAGWNVWGDTGSTATGRATAGAAPRTRAALPAAAAAGAGVADDIAMAMAAGAAGAAGAGAGAGAAKEAAKEAAEDLVDDTAKGLTDATKDEAEKVTKKGGIGSVISGGLRAAGSLLMKGFMAFLVLDIVTALAQEPLGSIVEGLGAKRVGRAIKEDFWGGLLAGLESALIGTEDWVGRPGTLRVGNLDADTKKLARLGLGNPMLDRLQSENPIESTGAQTSAAMGLATSLEEVLAKGWAGSQSGPVWVGNEQAIAQSVALALGGDTVNQMMAELAAAQGKQDYMALRGQIYEKYAELAIAEFKKQAGVSTARREVLITEALDRAGWGNLTTHEIERLPAEVQARLAELIDGDIDAVRVLLIDELLRNAGAKRDPKTRSAFLAEAGGDAHKAAVLALEANAEESGLAGMYASYVRDRAAARSTYEGRDAQAWVAKYGAAIEEMAKTGGPNRGLLESLGLVKKGASESELQQAMNSLFEAWPEMLRRAGMTASKPMHDALMETIQQGLKDGLSLEEIRKVVEDEGLGALWQDMFNDPRGAGQFAAGLMSFFDDAIKSAKGKSGKERAIEMWNLFMPDEFDIKGAKGKDTQKRFDTMVSMWLEQFRGSIEGADTAPAKNALLKVINSMLPPGRARFGSWQELLDSLRPGGAPKPGGERGALTPPGNPWVPKPGETAGPWPTPKKPGTTITDTSGSVIPPNSSDDYVWDEASQTYKKKPAPTPLDDFPGGIPNFVATRGNLLRYLLARLFIIGGPIVGGGAATEPSSSGLGPGREQYDPTTPPPVASTPPTTPGSGLYPGTPADLYGMEAYEQFRQAGIAAVEQVAAGMGDAEAMEAVANAMGLAASAVMDYLPQSPAKKGPLMGLMASGMNVVGQVADGIRAMVGILPAVFEQSLRVPDLSGWTQGILNQIRVAIAAANVLMLTGFANVHPSGPTGGTAPTITRTGSPGDEATQGGFMGAPQFMPQPVPMPALASIPQARFAGLSGPTGGGGGGTNMPIYIDRMTVMGPEDESSIVRRLAFLSPTGR